MEGLFFSQEYLSESERNCAIRVFELVHYEFSSYNVWKHVRYSDLTSRQPGW